MNTNLCYAGSGGCEAICKALRAAGSSGLKELNLSRMPIEDRAAAAIAGLLSSSRVLERLLLAETNITDAGAQLICNALQVRGGGSRLESCHAGPHMFPRDNRCVG